MRISIFEYPEKGGQVAIRMGDWKGVRTEVRKNPYAPWQIYNLAADRNETTNIADKHPEIVKQFAAIQKKRASAFTHQGMGIYRREIQRKKC